MRRWVLVLLVAVVMAVLALPSAAAASVLVCPPISPATLTDGFVLDPDSFCAAEHQARRWPAVPGLVIVLLSVLIIVTAVVIRRRELRGPAGRGIIIPEFAPPEGLNIMVASHLVGRSRAAVPAQLLALALSKRIRLLERAMRRGRIRYAVQLITSEGADPYELAMLDVLFSPEATPGATRELRATDRQLSKQVRRISIGALRESQYRGWRQSSGAAQWLLLLFALPLPLITAVIAFVAWASWAFSPWLVIGFFTAPVALVVTIVNIRFVGRLTDSGALVRDHLLGLRDYLQLAESDRVRLLQASDTAERIDSPGGARTFRLYEDLLPYAVVWGVDESWISELVGDAIDLDAPPAWLSDPNLLTFVGAVDGFVATVRSIAERSSTLLARTRVDSLQPPHANRH